MKIFTKVDKNRQSGQMLLIVLLISIVGLTVGLFLLGRTTTDISLTTKISDSSRAFNAAEAGIEAAIQDIANADGSTQELAPGLTYTAQALDMGGGDGVYPATAAPPTELGDSFTVWLVPYDEATGTFDTSIARYTRNPFYICFSNDPGNPANRPAIGVTLYYINGDDPANLIHSSYNGYDPITRTPDNNFLNANFPVPECPTITYPNKAQVQFNLDFGSDVQVTGTPDILVAISLRPVYFPATIAVKPNGGGIDGELPKQGNDITSTGNLGEITRRINVKEPFPVPAPFLDYAIYSTGDGTDLSK